MHTESVHLVEEQGWSVDLLPVLVFCDRGMVGEVCSWTRTGSAPLRASPPANANQGMTQILRQSPAFNSSSFASDSKAAEYNTNIRKYSRLLILEETAMEDQIRR